MYAWLRLLPTLTCVLALTACPTGRRGGDDDDAAAPVEPGLFLWNSTDYYGGYYLARLLLPLENGLDCDDVYGGYALYDDDPNWIHAYVYRGAARDWEQEYVHLYDEDCSMDDSDYEEARCFSARGTLDGNEHQGDIDDTLRIDAYSSALVEGSLRLWDVDYDFRVTNCGEVSVYDRSAPAKGEQPAWAGPTAAPSWKLRFR